MKKLHIISHSHLDREWYMSFEEHRARLVELMDTLIDLMEKNPDYKYFHLDGQFIVIEDYLQIKPYMKDRLFKLIRDGRIQIGPWYVLQDEYLTDGEANIRNMLVGLKLCRKIGAKPCMIGYFPDSFGNISQAPQILNGFNIDKAAFGRGIGDLGYDNTITSRNTSNKSELIWESPDGSAVTSVMFCNWYHNAMELPTDEKEAKERIAEIVKNTSDYALTPHLLGLNGCDHQPIQKDLPEALETAKKVADGVEIEHSNFNKYFDAILPYADSFSHLEGEIAGQLTKGYGLLINTASTHVPMKIKNHKAQNLLTQQAEPINALSMLLGDEYRYDTLLYSWKTLMENHPHDSICCCSVDDVIREMDIRFDKSMQSAAYVREEAKNFIAKSINTKEDKNIIVFHTDGKKTTGFVKVYVDFDRDEEIKGIAVYDKDGRLVPSVYKVIGDTFTYTLPKDSFRKVKYVNRAEVTLLVSGEGVGYETYTVKNEKAEYTSSVKVFENGGENEYISFEISENGSLSVTDKKSGIKYHNLNVYEDTGDMGNGYTYVPAEDDTAYLTVNDKAKISIEEQAPFYVKFRIENSMSVPKEREGNKRGRELDELKITTFVTLAEGIGRLDIETEIQNNIKNHRVRALFFNDIKTDVSKAEGQFDLVERNIEPPKSWENPLNPQRFDLFFALDNEEKGLLVASRGLKEYEISRDGKNTMGLVLLRGVGEMGDWGVFPAPDMQCLGTHKVEYSIVPYSASEKSEAYALGRSFAGDRLSARFVRENKGFANTEFNLLSLSGEHLTMSALKKNEHTEGITVRIYNTDTEKHQAEIKVNKMFKSAYTLNLNEDRTGEVEIKDGKIRLDIPKKKIMTIELI